MFLHCVDEQFLELGCAFRTLDAPADHAALRANKCETFEWLKFTLEGAGARTHGYAFTDTDFAGFRI